MTKITSHNLIIKKTRKCILIYFLTVFSPAPFNGSNDRVCTKELNNFPGAGSYASREKKIVPKVQDKMNNAFTTKVSIILVNQLVYR